jgi:hypothetical protein
VPTKLFAGLLNEAEPKSAKMKMDYSLKYHHVSLPNLTIASSVKSIFPALISR